MGFAALFIIVLVQLLVAGVVLFFLRNVLDKELIEAALEKFQGLAAGEDFKEIRVNLGRDNVQARARFEELARRRFPRAHFTVAQDAALRGGVVIIMGSEALDFSVAGRLKGFWS